MDRSVHFTLTNIQIIKHVSLFVYNVKGQIRLQFRPMLKDELKKKH